ncbi:MAG: sigma-70 family polymerase sigma factor [Bacteroidetes bacterium]|jgi:RNA polymerase sigma-70 factor (ECF subfamily)|nr:sigma-70 family polymerase sigma factor [Bacteroidota bacterium]
MEQQEILPNLFRTEFRKITAVLCKHFGIAHIELAEDLAGETFLAALETWPYKGVPENPAAWLYSVAKNKAKNHLQRYQLFTGKIAAELKNSLPAKEEMIDLSDKNISDSQLQMLFTICHPCIPAEAQIGLALRILCGFGIDEIANAFLSNKETINKRLFRAREKLRAEKVQIEVPSVKEIDKRLETVLTTLYLLYNEGYYSETYNSILREELCLEAMRLTYLLMENEGTNTPAVNALFALMCFYSSRFGARRTESGEIILYADQDESLWNQELIAKGVYYLHKAASGDNLSKYHIEANIAWWHTRKEDTHEKWEAILQLYNQLLQMEYSPIAALNRTFALSKANGKEAAILEAEKLQLKDNPYYYHLLGELYTGSDTKKAKEHLEKAMALAKTETDRKVIAKKIKSLYYFS